MSCRRPPLHTCGAAFMEIADKAYTNAQHLNGPLDDRIFALESVAEAIFPPSRFAFDKIDELVHVAEILPGKFDEAINNFPTIDRMGKCPGKEIVMDMNSNERSNESTVVHEESAQKTESQSLDRNEIKDVARAREGYTYKDALEKQAKVTKGTYKDALEKGTKKEENRQWGKDTRDFGGGKEENWEGRKKKRTEKKKDRAKVEKQRKEATREAKKGRKKNDMRKQEESADKETEKSSDDKGDQILEPESSWLMKLGKYGKQSSFSRSASFKW
ncbi:hypothetical protein GH714_029529 [Hevea brasiliensis]|uniref:Uncharacterized protein n=1 Tax=Hevea brasiliensis TaxID=3981 RepID=A0A6A6KV84_HEVBR|nr:hypothetical protein GH714_029529 [Hevea brasiliensis]